MYKRKLNHKLTIITLTIVYSLYFLISNMQVTLSEQHLFVMYKIFVKFYVITLFLRAMFYV